MKNWGWLICIIGCWIGCWSCQSKNNVPLHQIHPQYAQLFFFSVDGLDTTLHIIHGGDTLAIHQKSVNQFHLLSTTQVGFFSLLNNNSDIKGLVYPQDVDSPELQNRWKQKQLVELNPGKSEINHELLWSNPADIVLYSPFDPIDFALPKGTEKVPFADYEETHPLGRLEWVKVIGFLSNRSKLAEDIFKSKVKQYQSNICTVKQPQTVVVGSWDGEYFYINGQKSNIHQLLLDAGHQTLSPEKNGNAQWDKEMLWSKLPAINHLIWITTSQQKPQLEKEMNQPESWQKKWGITPHFIMTDTCSYFQKGIIQPEKLLYDLSHLNETGVKTFVTN
jgi:hypothetical protein